MPSHAEIDAAFPALRAAEDAAVAACLRRKFGLTLKAANEGDGPSAFVIGQFLDPSHPDRATLDKCFEKSGLPPGCEVSVSVSRSWTQRSAETGFVRAQSDLAIALSDAGHHEESIQWAQRAAERGCPSALSLLGTAALYGHGMPLNGHAAVDFCRRAAAGGKGPAAVLLGSLLTSGQYAPVDEVEARRWLVRGVELAVADGDVAAAAQARHYLSRLSEPLAVAARASLMSVAASCGACSAALLESSTEGLCVGCRTVRYCSTRCQRKAWSEHKAACRAAGAGTTGEAAGGANGADASSGCSGGGGIDPVGVSSGARSGAATASGAASLIAERAAIIVATNLSRAALSSAASRGDSASAQFVYGTALLSGELGVTVNVPAGKALVSASAARGFAHAQATMATLCLESSDDAGAFRWARAAADAGIASGVSMLGHCFFHGIGVAADAAEAQRLWTAAAEEGDSSALANLAADESLPAVKAIAFLERAIAGGHDVDADTKRLSAHLRRKAAKEARGEGGAGSSAGGGAGGGASNNSTKKKT